MFLAGTLMAQNRFSCVVEDTATHEKLPSVSAIIPSLNKSAVSDSNGRINFNSLPSGKLLINFSFVGYEQMSITIRIPQDNGIIISLKRKEDQEEAIIVTASRTNSRIEDLPTKVEVLGSEEVGEENGIKPGNIASLLGDVAGIQIQQSSAITGNAEARIQGLPGKYTQLLRDGMPLFGGYSGSFSILQIPPQDLKQIEIIKGSNSTLYGGGAIAGMLNLVSKSPRQGHAEKSITLNQSSLKESNLNIYFSGRNKKAGYTLFSGGTYQRAVDVNNDGFSDVPDLKTVFFHPRLFIYPGTRSTITAGYNLTYEDRNGGDMQVIHHEADAQHQFFIQNKLLRNTLDAGWNYSVNKTDKLSVKGTVSFFSRNITTSVFGMRAGQTSWFSEINYVKKLPAHAIVAGLNFTGEYFHKKQPDSTLFANYRQTTTGLFLQDDWTLGKKFIAEAGLRLDHHSSYGNFVLPRISLLYRISPAFTTRLGGGLGYRSPGYFETDLDERSLPRVVPDENLHAEQSAGLNWDINFKKMINGWHLTVNQLFYITDIRRPVIDSTDGAGKIRFYNAGKPLNTKGFETYVAATQGALELYLGYTYTLARQLYDPAQPNVSLSARNKLAMVLAYEFAPHFRAGVEAAYTGKQYLDNGSTTPGYLFGAAMVRYDISRVSLVLNCENLFDYRQTRKESIVSGLPQNPSFKQLWAPIDGRVINLSAKIDLSAF